MSAASRTILLPVVLGLCGLFLTSPAVALDGWLHKRDDGLEAAQKSGKPVLVVTLWGNGV